MPDRPDVDCEQEHAALSVGDVRAAADFYTQKLGFTLAFMEGNRPSIAGVNVGRVQMFLRRARTARLCHLSVMFKRLE